MKIAYAFLADAAQYTPDGRLWMLGGDIDTLFVPDIPITHPLPEECYIDWRTVQPVSKLAVVNARASMDYVCTIKEPMISEIRGRYWDYFFRPLPRPGN